MVSARRLLTMQAYSQTPEGKAAAKRSHDNYVSKRRDSQQTKLVFNTIKVRKLLSNWGRKK